MQLEPILIDEFYLAKAAGRDVNAPEPEYTMPPDTLWLAKLAGYDVCELKAVTRYQKIIEWLIEGGDIDFTPITRLDYFMFSAGDESITAPQPIPRREHFWDNISISSETIVEIEGELPLTIYSNGDDLLDYRIYGDTVQDGEPSPDNPVEVVGVGERTENLFDYKRTDGIINKTFINQQGAMITDNSYYMSYPIVVEPNKVYTWTFSVGSSRPLHTAPTVAFYDENNEIIDVASHGMGILSITFIVPMDTAYIRVPVHIDNNQHYMAMLTPGTTTPDHYIPYGYEVDVETSNDTETITTPIYIGDEPLHKIGDYADHVDCARGVLVRWIKKLVLTGKENIKSNHINVGLFNISPIRYPRISAVTTLCTHYLSQGNVTQWQDVSNKNCCCYIGTSSSYILYIRDSSYSTIDDFNSYLSSQYEQGTPVTVWYVLAEPEEIPLENLNPIPTFDGTTIIDYDGEPKPSKMYAEYTTKQTAYVSESGEAYRDVNGQLYAVKE